MLIDWSATGLVMQEIVRCWSGDAGNCSAASLVLQELVSGDTGTSLLQVWLTAVLSSDGFCKDP